MSSECVARNEGARFIWARIGQIPNADTLWKSRRDAYDQLQGKLARGRYLPTISVRTLTILVAVVLALAAIFIVTSNS